MSSLQRGVRRKCRLYGGFIDNRTTSAALSASVRQFMETQRKPRPFLRTTASRSIAHLYLDRPCSRSFSSSSTTKIVEKSNAILDKLKAAVSTNASSTGFPSATGAVLLVFGGAMAARWWYTSNVNDYSILLDPKTGAPRPDQSKVTIVLPVAKSKNSTRNVLKTKPKTDNSSEDLSDEEASVALQVDQQALTSFLKIQQEELGKKKSKANEETQIILHEQLGDALQECRTRGVQQFANWYFSYTTTYRLLSIAMQSAAKHVVTFRKEQTLQEAVTRDLQLYIVEKYQAMVLRPAVTDPKVHRATIKTLEIIHAQVYQPALVEMESAMQDFAASKEADGTTSAPARSPSMPLSLPSNAVRIELDWRAQLQKAQHLPVAYEKRPPEFSLALIGGGAVAGKVAGGAAIKAMSTKLAAPFVTKAVGSTLGGKVAAAGVAGGALAGGPLGAGLGAAVGVAMDMAVNQGISLMQRSAFEADVLQSLDATFLEWEGRILPEINRVVHEEWFAQLDAMLKLEHDS